MNVQFIYDNNDVSRDKDETSTYALFSGFPEILPILDLICIWNGFRTIYFTQKKSIEMIFYDLTNPKILHSDWLIFRWDKTIRNPSYLIKYENI